VSRLVSVKPVTLAWRVEVVVLELHQSSEGDGEVEFRPMKSICNEIGELYLQMS
jgi:hypothetical protein